MEANDHKGLILLVDDDDMVRDLIARCLQAAGYHVIQANGGHDAIRKFREHASSIQLLLTDIVMPDLFEDQLALRLLETKPELKVVMMSGNSPESLETELGIQEGRNFLRKPFLLDELRDCIEHQLHQHSR